MLGPRLDGEWIVKSGLAPGDHVVVDGVQKLRPGVAVSTEPSGPANVAAEPGSAPNGS